MMTDDPVEEHRAGNHEDMVGIMMCCRHCEEYFTRRNNRQEYCDKEECQEPTGVSESKADDEGRKKNKRRKIIMTKLEYQEKDGKVFCPLVNKWLVAKPEEKVRQRYICNLVNDSNFAYPKSPSLKGLRPARAWRYP